MFSLQLLTMLQNKTLLQKSKNLLAFSGGVDSSALLFLLLENSIAFDIAIVDYAKRDQSKEEVAFAQKLAHEHNFECYLLTAPTIEKNFESNARAIRYDFFESLIEKYSYENLLTAHHLGDRLEWMLMQFCKGAGCYELSGMQSREQRDGYSLLRPLLHLDKSELLEYLHTNNLPYFIDESNSDPKYKRNEFRHKYALPLLEKYLSGIKKSFEYLDADVSELVEEITVQEINQLAYFKKSGSLRSDIIAIDRYLKSKSQLITAAEKKLLKTQKCSVLGRKYVVDIGERFIFIAPFQSIKESQKMSKALKEKMRRLKIEPKLRAYLSTDAEALSFLSELLK